MDKQLKKGAKILARLEAEGFQAYFVGGAVRDHILKRPIKDIDITTDAQPAQVEALFEKTFRTGAAFGTLTVVTDDLACEVTTFRREAQYDNHRHPSQLTFSKDIKEDLSRRDFTINQLIMDKTGHIYDYYNGKKALAQQRIETIGEAQARFEEDALRMMRAFRFQAQLNFSLEENTFQAIVQKKALLKKIAIERIQEELFKMLDAPYSHTAVQSMRQSNVLKTLDLDEAFKHIEPLKKPYTAKEAFAIFYLHDHLKVENFRLSKRWLKQFEQVKHLHPQTKQSAFEPKQLYDYTKSSCLFVNRINVLLGYDDQSAHIKTIDKNLTLRKQSDLALNGNDILKHLKPKDKKHIRLILEALINDVLYHQIANQKPVLLKQAKAIYQTIKESEK